ncbi:gamma-glutamylcyclotransferase [Larkinella harenae]
MLSSATPETHMFVYGTLLSVSKVPMAEYFHQHSELCGTGFFSGRLYDLGTYPGAVYKAQSETVVHGEIYRLKPDFNPLLHRLDEYEGDEYIRAIVPVQTNSGLVNCWTYLFSEPTDALTLIASGRFLPKNRPDTF